MVTHRAETTAAALSDRYRHVREQSLALVKELLAEDTVVQTMPDVSPTKWHLAHITWFFERFVLEPGLNDYSRFNDDYHYLFNSYYYTAGQMHARPKRGLLSRPTLAQVLDYRSYVDTAMQQLLQNGRGDQGIIKVVTLGLNHEQPAPGTHADGHQARVLLQPDAPARVDDRWILPQPHARWRRTRYSDGEVGHTAGRLRRRRILRSTMKHHATMHVAARTPYRRPARHQRRVPRVHSEDGGYAKPRALVVRRLGDRSMQRGWRRPLVLGREKLQTEFTLGRRKSH